MATKLLISVGPKLFGSHQKEVAVRFQAGQRSAGMQCRSHFQHWVQ